MDNATPMATMIFAVMAALAQTDLETTRERITGSVVSHRVGGRGLVGRRRAFPDFQIRNSFGLIEAGKPATCLARDLGMSRATLDRRIREWCRNVFLAGASGVGAGAV